MAAAAAPAAATAAAARISANDDKLLRFCDNLSYFIKQVWALNPLDGSFFNLEIGPASFSSSAPA
jgi:hypothetical protein